MTWGLNLGLDNATNAANMATSIIKAFDSHPVRRSGVKLDMIEIGTSKILLCASYQIFDANSAPILPGNEPDLYKNNGLRPKNWTVAEYVADWIAIAEPAAQAAQLHEGGSVSFLGASFAGQGFTPTQIFNLGILDSAPGTLISTYVDAHTISPVR